MPKQQGGGRTCGALGHPAAEVGVHVLQYAGGAARQHVGLKYRQVVSRVATEFTGSVQRVHVAFAGQRRRCR